MADRWSSQGHQQSQCAGVYVAGKACVRNCGDGLTRVLKPRIVQRKAVSKKVSCALAAESFRERVERRRFCLVLGIIAIAPSGRGDSLPVVRLDLYAYEILFRHISALWRTPRQSKRLV